MLRIVTSPGEAVVAQLASPSFRRLGVEHRVYPSGADILADVREHGAQLVIVERELGDMTGFELCAHLRADPALKQVRVMLALSRLELGPTTLQRLTAVGCDDLLALPAPGEELYQQVARLFRLPHRFGRRIAVQLLADIEAENLPSFMGLVVNLSPTGAGVVLDHAPEALPLDLERVKLTVSRPLEGQAVVAHGRIVWRAAPKGGDGWSFGVELDRPDQATRAALAALSMWDIVELPSCTQVALQGDLTEAAEFEDLADRLAGMVQFDLGAVRYLNSVGVRKWVGFLDQLKHVTSYTFVRCSTAFVLQASMIARLLGDGHIDSFWAPYVCERCENEEQRLLHVAVATTPAPSTTIKDLAEAQFRCSKCEGPLVLDEVPERVFAFLERDAPSLARSG